MPAELWQPIPCERAGERFAARPPVSSFDVATEPQQKRFAIWVLLVLLLALLITAPFARTP